MVVYVGFCNLLNMDLYTSSNMCYNFMTSYLYIYLVCIPVTYMSCVSAVQLLSRLSARLAQSNPERPLRVGSALGGGWRGCESSGGGSGGSGGLGHQPSKANQSCFRRPDAIRAATQRSCKMSSSDINFL